MKKREMKSRAPSGCRDPVILCVDDEPGILSALRRCFRNEPYRIITSGDAEEALGWLASLPVVDLVIADERMPRMTGTDMLREVRQRSPTTARAILTGYPTDTLIQKGLEVEADTFVYKPWDNKSLRETVHRILRNRTPVQQPDSDERPGEASFDVGGEGG